MKRAEIEMRIRLTERRLATETHPSTLATLNRCLERLIMMEAEDDATTETVPTVDDGSR